MPEVEGQGPLHTRCLAQWTPWQNGSVVHTSVYSYLLPPRGDGVLCSPGTDGTQATAHPALRYPGSCRSQLAGGPVEAAQPGQEFCVWASCAGAAGEGLKPVPGPGWSHALSRCGSAVRGGGTLATATWALLSADNCEL